MSELEFEAMRWACMDACTGAQVDGPTFKRLYPNGMNAEQFNKAVCAIADEIEAFTPGILKGVYFKIAEQELANKQLRD